MNDGTAASGPRIERINAKVASLERRIEWLQERLKGTSRNERSRTFDKSELDALEAAVLALRYHRAALDVETDPVLALVELTESVEDVLPLTCLSEHEEERIDQAVTRAKRVLKELSSKD